LIWVLMALVERTAAFAAPTLGFQGSAARRRAVASPPLGRLRMQGWEKDVEEPEEGDKEEPKKLNFFKRLMRQSDDYKEASRVFRRTVFTNKDWQEFRSSARLWKNISTMFTSGIIRGLWFELTCLTTVALSVVLINKAILSGVLMPYVPFDGTFLFSLPTLPFQLSSPALALLLVFRTNTVYARWNEARVTWGLIEGHATSLARNGISYLEKDEREEHTRRVIAATYCLQRHFQRDSGAGGVLRSKLEDLLGKSEADRLMAQGHLRPTQAFSDLTRISRRSKSIDGSTKARFDLHLDALNQALITCERLIRTPVPLVYTRHTSRFLGMWVLLLPLAMVRELQDSFILIPISLLVGIFFFGIEELGVQLEEPFSLFALEDITSEIEQRLGAMLRYDVEVEDPLIGGDAKSLY